MSKYAIAGSAASMSYREWVIGQAIGGVLAGRPDLGPKAAVQVGTAMADALIARLNDDADQSDKRAAHEREAAQRDKQLRDAEQERYLKAVIERATIDAMVHGVGGVRVGIDKGSDFPFFMGAPDAGDAMAYALGTPVGKPAIARARDHLARRGVDRDALEIARRFFIPSRSAYDLRDAIVDLVARHCAAFLLEGRHNQPDPVNQDQAGLACPPDHGPARS